MHDAILPPLVLVGTVVLRSFAHAQLPPPPVPDGNPITVEKARLGKALFWDEQFASGRTLACGSCHQPAAGGSDPRATGMHENPGFDHEFGTADDMWGSPGVVRSDAQGLYVWESLVGFGFDVQVTPRKSLSVLMAVYAPETLWDGTQPEVFADPETGEVLLPSGAALESQALVPLKLDREMGHEGREWSDILGRIAAVKPLALAEDVPADLVTWIAGRSYPELFDEVFGDPAITAAGFGMAIATYERTLVPDQTPLDAWLGGDANALTQLELDGMNLFLSNETSCGECHPLPLLTNHAFEYLGVRPAEEDRGRFYKTLIASDKGKQRVPSLRNVELGAPYMHTGRFMTLADVIEFYDRGGDFDEPQKSALIRPLNLDAAEKAALVAFLGRPLTDVRARDEVPPFDRPRLYGEGKRPPQLVGGAVPGSGGHLPGMVALEPPHVGNPSFTVGVQNALGAAPAVLVLGGRLGGGGLPFARVDGASFRRIPALAGDGAGAGHGSFSIPIPDDPALVGETLEMQWWILDPGAANGIAASEVAIVRWF